jgi:hypothetical protein
MFQKSMISLAAFVCFGLFSPGEVFAEGRVFSVTVQNGWNQDVRFKRVAEGEQEHAFQDLAPNGTKTFNIRFDSDQVFLAWSRGKLLGMQKFALEGSEALGGVALSIDSRGGMSIAVKSR